jgi:hypothetical protein
VRDRSRSAARISRFSKKRFDAAELTLQTGSGPDTDVNVQEFFHTDHTMSDVMPTLRPTRIIRSKHDSLIVGTTPLRARLGIWRPERSWTTRTGRRRVPAEGEGEGAPRHGSAIRG